MTQYYIQLLLLLLALLSGNGCASLRHAQQELRVGVEGDAKNPEHPHYRAEFVIRIQ